MLSFLCGFLLYLISLACTLFHFFSLDLKLFLASQAPAPFISPPLPHTQAAPLHFSLTHNQFLSSSHTQLFWLDTSSRPSYPFYPSTIRHHTLSSLLSRRPGSSTAFPSGTFTPSPSALSSPLVSTASSCPGHPVLGSPVPHADMSSAHLQSQWPGRAIPGLWHQQTDERFSTQSCSCIQVQTGVGFGFVGFIWLCLVLDLGFSWFVWFVGFFVCFVFLLLDSDPWLVFYLVQRPSAFPRELRSVRHTHSFHSAAVKQSEHLPLTVFGCHQQQWEGHWAKLLWQQPGKTINSANSEVKPPPHTFLCDPGQVVQLLCNP